MRVFIYLAPVVFSFATPLLSQQLGTTELNPPATTSAVDGILDAFQAHALVGLGAAHGVAQEEDLYIALVSDPRFAADVGNVVVEFGDAAQQETIDRYVNGEDVPYVELRRVWSDTVGWSPAVTALGYANFFAQLRRVNSGLTPSKRIHVWLGDPPIDWSKVKTRADVTALSERNRYPAELIKSQILAKHLKALVIYGTFHFYGKSSVRGLVEADYPNTFFVVTPYSGYPDKACSENFEKSLQKWPSPALAAPVRDSALETELHAPGCHFMNGTQIFFPPEVTEEQKAKMMANWEDESSGITGDALLYLGPAASLTESPTIPDFYLDAAFRKEIERRAEIMTGLPMRMAVPLTVSPHYIHSYGRWAQSNSK